MNFEASGLVVEQASVTYPGAQSKALDDVSVALERGRILAVVGPSGCGKSTLLRVVAGLEAMDRGAGRISFDGDDVTATPTHKRDFALMFQDGQLFGHMSVGENVVYGLRRRGVSAREAEPRVRQLLELTGLTGMENRYPATLSGGQQQRVALARALAAKPRLLLLDEPLSALDRTLRERLAGDLRDILTSEGVTALFVTHDHQEALTVADDLAVMRAGKVVQHGPAADVWRAPADLETAEFLGYTTTLHADEAVEFGLEPETYALRRAALVAHEPKPSEEAASRRAVNATIERASFADEYVLLDVVAQLAGAKRRLPAVAPLSSAWLAAEPGQAVTLVANSAAAVAFH